MNFSMTRRSVLAALAAAVPAVALSKTAKAWTVASTNANFPAATGLWKTLEHVTDGSDPSTALAAPPAPRFTPEIQALAGKEIELTGYLYAAGRRFRQEAGISPEPRKLPLPLLLRFRPRLAGAGDVR